MSDDLVKRLRDAVTDAPKELFYNVDYQYQHARHITLSPPTTDFPFVKYVPAARIEELEKERDEALRRRDAWKDRAENHVEIVNALRSKTKDGDSRTLSRALLGAAKLDAEAEVNRLTALLREAEEALRDVLDWRKRAPDEDRARALLARLEAREVSHD